MSGRSIWGRGVWDRGCQSNIGRLRGGRRRVRTQQKKNSTPPRTFRGVVWTGEVEVGCGAANPFEVHGALLVERWRVDVKLQRINVYERVRIEDDQ